MLLSTHSANAQGPFDYPVANLSTTWTNSATAPHSVPFLDGSLVRAILLRGSFGPKYACGFFCNGTCDKYLFAVYIVETNSGSGIVMPALGFPQVVWAANRNRLVGINATLQLTSRGDLILRDSDGSVAWSTKTAGKSVRKLSLSETGNLALLRANNNVVWQSFDSPTDSLVPGQKLGSGKKLSADGGVYTMSVNNTGLFAFRGSQVYFQKVVNGQKLNKEASYVKLVNGSLALYVHSAEPSAPDSVISLPSASSAQYLKLGSDGRMRLFEWASGWKEVASLFSFNGIRSES